MTSGGTRGIIPLMVLKYLELMLKHIRDSEASKALPSNVAKMFSFAAGTSTGSIGSFSAGDSPNIKGAFALLP